MEENCFLERCLLEAPVLLSQYSYYLNKEGTKSVIVGYNSTTLHPSIALFSPITCEKVELSKYDWLCIKAILKYGQQYLIGNTNNVFYRSQHVQIDSTMKNSERLIRIVNFNMPDSHIELNLEEFETLIEYSYYISKIVIHYSELCCDVSTFFESYKMKCIEQNKQRLDPSDFCLHFSNFGLNSKTINWFRIFNEIPIVCREKLAREIHE